MKVQAWGKWRPQGRMDHGERLKLGTKWQGWGLIRKAWNQPEKGEVSLAVECPGYWRCQDRGTSTKDSGWSGAELI